VEGNINVHKGVKDLNPIIPTICDTSLTMYRKLPNYSTVEYKLPSLNLYVDMMDIDIVADHF